MKKLIVVARKAIADGRTVALAGAAAIFFIVFFHVVVYPEYGANMNSTTSPEGFGGLTGEAGSIGSAEGYIAAFWSNSLALMAALAVIVGTAATAGEESGGTLDLLIAQPVRRASFIWGKAAGLAICLLLVDLVATPAFVLANLRGDAPISTGSFAAATLGGGPAVLIFLGISLLAAAQCPSRGWAAMAASAALVLAYFVNAAGTIGPLHGVRNLSPFYWADASHVFMGGFDIVRTAGLTVAALLLCALAAVAFERREISTGGREPWRWQAILRKPFTPAPPTSRSPSVLGGPFAGRFGVARKTAVDVVAVTVAVSSVAFLFALLLVLIYPAYRDALRDFEYPGALKGLLGEAGSFASPRGFLAAEFFGFVPLILAAAAIVLGTGATSGEESAGTLDMLLAQPIRRQALLEQKAVTLAGVMALAGLSGIPGFLLGRLFVGTEVSLIRFVSASAAMVLLSLVYLALALWAGATFPSRGAAALFVAAAVVAGYLLNVLGVTVDWLATPRRLSPFYWGDGSHALVSGFDWIRATALLATAIVLFWLALRSIQRRDLVAGGKEWTIAGQVSLVLSKMPAASRTSRGSG